MRKVTACHRASPLVAEDDDLTVDEFWDLLRPVIGLAPIPPEVVDTKSDILSYLSKRAERRAPLSSIAIAVGSGNAHVCRSLVKLSRAGKVRRAAQRGEWELV